MSQSKPESATQNFVCTGCSLLCDDIRWSQADSSFEFPVDCGKGREHLRQQSGSPRGKVSGVVDRDAYQRDVRRIAVELVKADFPLICGLVDQPVETLELSIELAGLVSAAIDWSGGFEPSAWHFAMQQAGRVSCSVAEMQHRADLVVVWNADPVTTHPRLLAGFIGDLTFVGTAENATSTRSGKSNIMSRSRQIDALRQMREAVIANAGRARTFEREPEGGLLESLEKAAYPVIVIDDRFAEELGNVGVLSLSNLVHDLNQRGECRLLHLSRQINRRGAENCFLSMTGAPFGVLFREGNPLFRGRDASADVILRRKEADFVLVVSHSLEPDLHQAIQAAGVPVATIGQSMPGSSIHIPAGRWGIETGGGGLACDGSYRKANALNGDGDAGGSAQVLRDLIQGVDAAGHLRP